MHAPMQHGWLAKAGRFRVEHMPCPNPGQPVTLSAPPKAIAHTIEGSLEGGLAVFRQHFAPTFTLGRDRKNRVRIIQHVPLGTMASALENHPGGVETNRVCRVQVEVAGHSQHHPWLPDPGVCEAYAALMHTLEKVASIPLQHTPVRRDPRKWLAAKGWFGHVDVPENVHWDSGELRFKELFRQARLLDHKPPKVTAKPRRRVAQPRTLALSRVAGRTPPAPLCPPEPAVSKTGPVLGSQPWEDVARDWAGRADAYDTPTQCLQQALAYIDRIREELQ